MLRSNKKYQLLIDLPEHKLFEDKFTPFCTHLSSLCFDPNELDLYAAGSELAGKIHRLHFRQNHRYNEAFLRQVLESADFIVSNRADCNSIEYLAHLTTLETAAARARSHPILKPIVAAIGQLVAAAIIAATGILAAVACGLFPPLGIVLGVVIGATAAMGATSIIAGLVGIGAFAASSFIFFKTVTRPTLASHLDRFVQAAKEPPLNQPHLP